MTQISQQSLDFLSLVSRAAVANPFSAERDAIDRQLLSLLPRKRGEKEIVTAIATEAEQILQTVLTHGDRQNLRNNPDTMQVISDAGLFAVFHKYMHKFDEHIKRQDSTPGQSLTLAFTDDVLHDLRRFQIDTPFEHAIALFFQMRRAFFFVHKHVGGQSEPVRLLQEQLWRTLFTHDLRFYMKNLYSSMEPFSILLLGETGVGKSQAAAALGRSAYIPFDLKTQSFVASFRDIHLSANISEYPETLIESELFGHKKGSFTGALENYAGLLGRTHANGMLFLDEIGELSTPVQVKLLRVLQERNYSPVGSHETRRFSGRLISATNAQLMSRIERGEFRSDLYYRLSSDVIELPTLKARLTSDSKELKRLTDRVLSRLLNSSAPNEVDRVSDLVVPLIPKDHHWPGNLREFEQCVRSILLHGRFERSAVKSQHPRHTSGRTEHLDAWLGVRWTADEMLSEYARTAYEQLGTFDKVAQRLEIDWRTVKKWVNSQKM